MKRAFGLLLTLFLAVAPVFAAPTQKKMARPLTDEEIYARLDKYIEEVSASWQLKGIVVMVGDDKDVLHKKCIGYRDEDAAEPVPMDEHTVFQIASVSKSFTTALVATLVDEGKIRWEDKVIDILPDFEMSDPWITKNAQIKDFCCHRTGLKDWNGSSGARLGYSKNEMMHLMKYITPAFDFRTGYLYNNMSFVIPALVVEKVTGKSWQQNIRERIYGPLGMDESLFRGETYVKAFEDKRASRPYRLSAANGEVSVTPYTEEEVGPGTPAASEAAGGIISTPTDMTKWAQFHLRRGTSASGQRVISEKQMDFLHNPVNIVKNDEHCLWGYGMAWFTEQWDKCKIVHHTGTNSGQIAICVFIPELNRTFTLNSNTELPVAARRALVYRYIDLVLGYEDYDYNADAIKEWHKENPAKAVKAVEPVAAPAEKFLTGTYQKNEDWGSITVSRKNGKLYLKMDKTGREWELKHVNGPDFEFLTSSSRFGVRFGFDGSGKKASTLDFTIKFLPEFGGWTRK